MVVIAYHQRDNYLEKLSIYPGEEILFEDSECKFRSRQQVGKWALYPMGFIRVTNMRIILTQRYLFGKKHMIRFIINYKDVMAGPYHSKSIVDVVKKGHQVFNTSLEYISFVHDEKDKDYISIKPVGEIGNEENLLRVGEVQIYPNNMAPFESLFGKG